MYVYAYTLNSSNAADDATILEPRILHLRVDGIQPTVGVEERVLQYSAAW